MLCLSGLLQISMIILLCTGHTVVIVNKWTRWRSSLLIKKSLKIPMGQSESVYRRRTDNTMAKRYLYCIVMYFCCNTALWYSLFFVLIVIVMCFLIVVKKNKFTYFEINIVERILLSIIMCLFLERMLLFSWCPVS